MMKRAISLLMAILLLNVMFAQTNTNIITANTNDNYFRIPANTYYISPILTYGLSPTFMDRMLRESDFYKQNELKYLSNQTILTDRIKDRDAQVTNLQLLYGYASARADIWSNQMSYCTNYISYQEQTIDNAIKREKLGTVGYVLIFGLGFLLGGLAVYGFSKLP